MHCRDNAPTVPVPFSFGKNSWNGRSPYKCQVQLFRNPEFDPSETLQSGILKHVLSNAISRAAGRSGVVETDKKLPLISRYQRKLRRATPVQTPCLLSRQPVVGSKRNLAVHSFKTCSIKCNKPGGHRTERSGYREGHPLLWYRRSHVYERAG